MDSGEEEARRLFEEAREQLVAFGIAQEDEVVAHENELARIDKQLEANRAHISELFRRIAPFRTAMGRLREERLDCDMAWRRGGDARAKRRRNAIEAFHIAERNTMGDVDVFMPMEMWFHVAEFLELGDCLSLSSTCRELRKWYTGGKYAMRRHVIQHRKAAEVMAASQSQGARTLVMPHAEHIIIRQVSAHHPAFVTRSLVSNGAWLSIVAFDTSDDSIYDGHLVFRNPSSTYPVYDGYHVVYGKSRSNYLIFFGMAWQTPIWFDAAAKYRLASAPTYDGHLLLFSDKWDRPLDTTTGKHVPVPEYPDPRREEVLRQLGLRCRSRDAVKITRCGDIITAEDPMAGWSLFRVFNGAVKRIPTKSLRNFRTVIVTSAGLIAARGSHGVCYTFKNAMASYYITPSNSDSDSDSDFVTEHMVDYYHDQI